MNHSSLRWLHNLKNPKGRLARWALELLEFDFKMLHRKGVQHHVPDALSRILEPAEVTARCNDPKPEQAREMESNRAIIVSTVVTLSKTKAVALPEREERETARAATF